MMGCEVGLFQNNYKAMNSLLTGAFLFVGVYCVIFNMKIIWYIIDKFNARFRKPQVCGYHIVNNPKHFLNKPVQSNTEKSHTNAWAIIFLGYILLKMVKGIL